MEEENFKNDMNISCSTKNESGDDDEDVPLPGFRFHPTDEELVGFYLRRKVENKILRIELIKVVDIYKYNPWDLPKAVNVGEKEWYFFCKRGRKYKNSVRPNRVTSSGFWKATGIDKPIYSSGRIIIGLKKSLVFYCGSAGKGKKTDWMMHEFRIPNNQNNHFRGESTLQASQEEVEVWTLCRILKRSKSHKRCLSDWREISLPKTTPNDTSLRISGQNHDEGGFISFEVPLNNKKQLADNGVNDYNNMLIDELNSKCQASNIAPSMNEYSKYDEWDELRSLVELAGNKFDV